MAEEIKPEFEGMLEAIKDLKQEYYIGTQEAYGFLREVQQIYSAPKKLADLINSELMKQGKVSYLATPERVACLERVIDNISEDIIHENFNESIKDDYILYILNPNLYLSGLSPVFIPLSGMDENMNVCSVFHSKPEKTAEIFLPYFKRANEDFCKSDAELSSSIIDLLREEYSKVENKIDDRKAAFPCREYFSSLLTELSLVDWENALSKESFNEIERVYIDFTKSDISTSMMLRRLIRDRVDHKLEYRRAVLCKWISDRKVEDYEQAMDVAEANLKFRKSLLEKMTEQNTPDVVIEKQEEMLKSAKFIRFLLGADKNFVKRYLKN